MSLALIIVVVTVIANLVIAAFVFLNNPKSASNASLTILSISSAGWTLFTYLALFSTEADIRLFWVRAVMIVTSVFGPSIYLLASSFPGSEIKVKKPILIATIVMSILSAVLSATPLVFTSLKNLPNGNFSLTPGPAIAIYGITLMGFMIAGFVTIIKKYLKSRGLERKQMSYFLVGLILTFGLSSLTNFVAVVVFKTIIFTYIGPPLTLFLVGSVSYAIIRHRLLDIRILVARAVLYTLLLIVLIGGYTLLIYTIFQFLPLGINRDVIFISIAVIVAFSFNLIKSLLAKLTDKFFFKNTYDTEKLISELTRILAAEIHIDQLSKKLLETLTLNIRVTNMAFISIQDKKIKNIDSVGFSDKNILNNDYFVNLLDAGRSIYIFENLENGVIKDFMRENEISVILPLKVETKSIGLLVLGPKSSGESYDDKDVDFFEIFGPEVAVGIQNAQSYKEIQEFNLTLEKKVIERTKELDEFVFIATHDLKTPVTAIDGYISLIEQEKPEFSADLKSDFEEVKAASGRLKQLVNDLLQVARGESGTIKVEVKPVDIEKIIEGVVKEVKPVADDKKVKLITSFDESTKQVLGDDTKLPEVIENLLSNAIKFNHPEGSVTIVTKKIDSMIQISVTDTGHGIPKEEQSKVFEKFFKYRGEATRDIQGTGLGLFVVRMLIEKMNGKITFTSEVEKGTTFTFTLPLAS